MTVEEQTDPSTDPTGVQLDFVRSSRSDSMGTAEKINMILDRVSDDVVIILEEGLTPDEKSKLVERTMGRIDGETFTGIEIETFTQSTNNNNGMLSRIIDRTPDPEMTLIGPADKVHTLNKDESLLQAVVHNGS